MNSSYSAERFRDTFKTSKWLESTGGTYGRGYGIAEVADQGWLAVSGTEVMVLIAAVVVVGWWVGVQRHPIRRCPSCNGTKKNAGSNSLRWGTCRRCGGKGEVRRFGAPKQ